MRFVLLLFLALLVGWASCACNIEAGKRYRSVDNCPINRMFRPLCGSDGCSYINNDALACARKENPELRIAHTGICNTEADPEHENQTELQ